MTHPHLCAALLQKVGSVVAQLYPELDTSAITLEPPRNPDHGDFASNAAMVLAPRHKQSPRAIAEAIVPALRQALPAVQSIDICGPGFINLTMHADFWVEGLQHILSAQGRAGALNLGQGQRVNVEYVSANPTGPLHIGHGRGAVFGDVLANLLAYTGFDVTREYYVNDAGHQITMLARSLHHRACSIALGTPEEPWPEGFYPGDYLIPVAQALVADLGGDLDADLLQQDEARWLPICRERALKAMINLIREDLAAALIHHDVFTHESTLIDNNCVQDTLQRLQQAGHIYRGVPEKPKSGHHEDWEAREQLLFKATAFGDDQDRAMQKSDGSWTYFSSDIAYHDHKVRRGFHWMINVFGADHIGYVRRLKAATAALSERRVPLDIKICQLVRFMEDGTPVKMSKRAGAFVTLRQLISAVGPEALRFHMLTRKNDAHMNFDLKGVLAQSRDNPIFYIQYAHARTFSLERQIRKLWPTRDLTPPADLATLTASPKAMTVIKKLADWPRQIERAVLHSEPHRLAFYLTELAATFHSLWTHSQDETFRFIVEDDFHQTQSRLALALAVRAIIAEGLHLFTIKPIEELR